MIYKTKNPPFVNGNISIYNCDCMDILRQTPDNYYHLSLVDPPYGIGMNGKIGGDNLGKATPYKEKEWDKTIPPPKYFDELKRVSMNQIIWGGNYFIENLHNSPCWIVWDKDNSGNFADCELAWTNFKTAVRLVKLRWNGMLQADMKYKEKRIHPTQKPVLLYDWIYKHYCDKGARVLDTHLGSGSNAIAAHYFGVGEFVGVELDKDYYNTACKRIKEQTTQLKLF